MFHRLSLFTRLLLVLLAAAVIPLSAAVFLNAQTAATAMRDQAGTVLARLAFSTAQRFEQYIQDNYTFLNLLARDPAVQQMVTAPAADYATLRPAVMQVIERGLKANPANDLIGVYNAAPASYEDGSGKTVSVPAGTAIVHNSPAAVMRDYSFRDWNKAALSGQNFTSAIQIGMATDLPGFTAAIPVKDSEGRIIGAVANRVAGPFARDILQGALGEQEGGYSFLLVSSDGLVMADTANRAWLYHSLGTLDEAAAKRVFDNKVLGGICPESQTTCEADKKLARSVQPFPAGQSLGQTLVQAAQQGATGSTRYCAAESASGCRDYHVAAYAPVRANGQTWMLVVVDVPENQFVEVVSRQQSSSLVLALLMGLSVCPVALVLARGVTTPLARLTHLVQQPSSQMFRGRETLLTRQDEIGALSRVLNDTFSAREHLIDDLKVARDKAEEANRLKSEFLATMSHELRTPFNVIIGLLDLVLVGAPGPLTDKQREFLERVRASAKGRLLPLINSILDLSKIEANRMEVALSSYSPREMLEALHKLHKTAFLGKGLSFALEFANELPPQVVGDRLRVEQIVSNLLSNALKFTEQGHVTLRAGVEGDHYFIQVQDTGIGIAPHLHSVIFEQFRQAEQSLTRQYGGSGLGLSIVERLCRLMGGTVSLASAVGVGSTFTVKLPLNGGPDHAAAR